MSSLSICSIGQVLTKAEKEVLVNEDKLSMAEVSVCISSFGNNARLKERKKKQLWRNDMPTCYNSPEELELLEYPRGANMQLTISRHAWDASSTDPSKAEPAYDLIQNVHVFRVTPVDAQDAGTREDSHFCWSSENKLHEGCLRMRQPGMKITYDPQANLISILACHGPRFGGEQVEYFVVVEFSGGVFLKSNVANMTTCS